MTITEQAHNIKGRFDKMAPVLHSLERHLIKDQNDAISERPPGDGEGGSRSGHSDPVGSIITQAHSHKGHPLAKALAKKNSLEDAMRGVNRSLDHLEHTVKACISDNTEYDTSNEPRCPGWNDELRARLGGCGSHRESYTRNDKTTGLRQLCAKCRRDEGIARRAEEAGAA